MVEKAKLSKRTYDVVAGYRLLKIFKQRARKKKAK